MNHKNFRIKKEKLPNKTIYTPQEKLLFFWIRIFHEQEFYSFEYANEKLCEYIDIVTRVEYLEPKCNCNDY